MKSKNISQAELADKLGVQRQTVFRHLKRWKEGKEPSIRLLREWCDCLEFDYKKIFQ